jgi:hypothetical protein
MIFGKKRKKGSEAIKYVKIQAVALILCFVFVFMKPPIVNACSCASLTPEEAIERTPIIFSGTVSAISKQSAILHSSSDPVQVNFQVDQTWKGPTADQIKISTEISSESCGYPFKANQEYLVYAYQDGDEIKTSLCSRSNLLSSAQGDLRLLGKGANPVHTSSLQNNSLWIIAIVILMAVGILLFIYTVYRRKR